MKNNNWQFVSFELAKEMKELGFKQESLFYWNKFSNTPLGKEDYKLSQFKLSEAKEHYSAYTVAELGEMLPIGSKTLKQAIYKNGKRTKKYEWICWRGKNYPNYEISETEADARAKMLIYLAKNKSIKPGQF